MEENEYRRMYRAAVPTRCVFEKGILARRCACPHARRHNLAEREALACESAAGRARCEAWLALLRKKAVFALQLHEPSQTLPHAKEIKVQVGGLLGLAECLSAAPEGGTWLVDGRVEDIHGLLAAAGARFGGLEEAPFDEIMRAVVHFRARRRRPGRR